MVARSLVFVAVSVRVGLSVGSHRVGWTRNFFNVPCFQRSVVEEMEEEEEEEKDEQTEKQKEEEKV